jgi:Cytochrome b562
MQMPISGSPNRSIHAHLIATMKSRILHVFCAVLFSTSLAIAADTPLGKEMEAMDDAYKAFRKTEDATQGAAKAREAQTHVAKSLMHLPDMLSKMPEGPARAKASASYRMMMGQLYVKLCEVEQAFLDNKLDKVAELVNDLKELKKKGHSEFMEEEE